MQLHGLKVMSQHCADHEGSDPQGKQLGEPGPDLVVRGRAGPGMSQQCPHASSPPVSGRQQGSFPEYPVRGIPLLSSRPVGGAKPVFLVQSDTTSAHQGPPGHLQGLYCPAPRQTISRAISPARTLRLSAGHQTLREQLGALQRRRPSLSVDRSPVLLQLQPPAPHGPLTATCTMHRESPAQGHTAGVWYRGPGP